MSQLLRLMSRLQREIDAGENPDLPLLGEIGDYLAGFPDACHHPKEDLIYRRLGERSADLGEIGADLEYEHERLGRMTRRYVEALDETREKGTPPKGLTATIDDLVRTYRRHMQMEETHLFPMAIRVLRKPDWDDINSTLFEERDPLADVRSSKFERLRDEIAELAAEHDERRRLLAAGDDLDIATLTSCEQLNEHFESRGLEVRLEPLGSDGYRLTDHGDVVLELPACNESRAAWCAYCYVKGAYS